MKLFNHDGVFFDVESPDVNTNTIERENVESLNIEEAVKEMPQGTIKLFDPRHIYSRLFRPGVRLKITWGIEVANSAFGRLLTVKRALPEVRVNSPGGGGSDRGEITYDISFMATSWRGETRTTWYESGTKRDVVATVMARLGVVVHEINFARMGEAVSPNSKVGQYETDYQFLVRLSDEWRAAFRLGELETGGLYGSFVDYSIFAGKSLTGRLLAAKVALYGRVQELSPTSVASGVTTFTTLNYGGRNANVKSYTWKDESADAANGDGVRSVMVNGEYQYFRQVVEDEKVVTYRLVPELIQAELETRGWSERMDLMVDYLSVKDFSQVKRFFVEDVSTTAPQGSGIVVNAEMLGDPYLTCGLEARIGDGFPDRVGAIGKQWWTRRVNHSISRTGYGCSVEVADAYAFSPTGQVLSVMGE